MSGDHNMRGEDHLPPMWVRALEMEFTDDGSPHTKSYHLGWLAGIEAAQQRLTQMHDIAKDRHNFYQHAAVELKKLKEKS